jgi:hypothetical protein
MGNDLPTLSYALTPFPLLPLRDVVVFPYGDSAVRRASEVDQGARRGHQTGKHILLVAQSLPPRTSRLRKISTTSAA